MNNASVGQKNEIKIEYIDKSTSDLKLLASEMAKGFCDDPFVIFLFPDEKSRLKKTATLIMGFLLYALPRGHVSVLKKENQYYGGAIWLCPEHAHVNPLSFLLTLLKIDTWKIFVYLGLSGIKRFDTYTKELESAHNREKEDHFYLLLVSLAPEVQKKGWGKKLLEPVTLLAREKKVNCYLETMNPRNHSFYLKNGYEFTYSSEILPQFCSMRLLHK